MFVKEFFFEKVFFQRFFFLRFVFSKRDFFYFKADFFKKIVVVVSHIFCKVSSQVFAFFMLFFIVFHCFLYSKSFCFTFFCKEKLF